jgi:hypothetical protein
MYLFRARVRESEHFWRSAVPTRWGGTSGAARNTAPHPLQRLPSMNWSQKNRLLVRSLSYLCEERELNPHSLAANSPSNYRVCHSAILALKLFAYRLLYNRCFKYQGDYWIGKRTRLYLFMCQIAYQVAVGYSTCLYNGYLFVCLLRSCCARGSWRIL